MTFRERYNKKIARLEELKRMHDTRSGNVDIDELSALVAQIEAMEQENELRGGQSITQETNPFP